MMMKKMFMSLPFSLLEVNKMELGPTKPLVLPISDFFISTKSSIREMKTGSGLKRKPNGRDVGGWK